LTIKKRRDVDLESGDIEGNQIVTVSYDGTNFQMDSQIATVSVPDVNGLTEDTVGDMDADFALVYDASAVANRKQKVNVFRATDAEIIAGSSTTKFTTPAQINERVKRIYVDVVPAGTVITTSLTTLYTQTIPANTFTANSQLIVRFSTQCVAFGS
jgi:hypothetical protein